MVDVGRSAAQRGLTDSWVLHKVIFLIHHGLCPTDEQNRIPVVQLPHLVRGQQLPPCHLVVGGVGTAAALGFSVGFQVDGGLTQHFRDKFVRAGLIPSQIKDAVRVAGDGFPIVLVQALDLGHVLNDGGGRDIPTPHGGKLPRESRQRHCRKFIKNKVYMAGQRPMVNLVGTVIERLKHLGIQQRDQKREAVIIVWDHSIERHLPLPQRVQIHVIVVRDGLDLGQIKRCQPHRRRHQNGFCSLA